MRHVLSILLVAACATLGAPGTAAAATSAPWCGNDVQSADRLPDAVAGRQIHVVYAIPSNGGDRFASMASAITADLAVIDAWWRREDPTRTLRFDTFAFPGCAAGIASLDLTSVRLPRDAAYYEPAETRFSRIATDVFSPPVSLAHPHKKYLVYYDGPAGSGDICGTASSTLPTQGPTYAVVYAQADRCGVVGAGYYAAMTAVHEVLHALGAVPRVGPPHVCPGSAGHACDHGRDVMLPGGTPNLPLGDYILDAGRDDYYGHSGSWWDVQDSDWLARLDRPQFPLGVSVEGRGGVSSDLPGIACPPTCSIAWDAGTQVALVAEPDEEQRFVGWSGACSGRGDCVVTMDSAQTVTARFGPASFVLTIAVTGRGRVVGDVTSRDCARRCVEPVDAETRVRLRAVPAKGWRFVRWTGACRGTRVTCTVTMAAARSVRATFRRR